MYVVIILEAAHEDLRNIVAYISNENPNAAETLGSELLDEAMPRIVALPRFPSQKTATPLQTHPWELSNLLPDQGTETGCRNSSFQAWSTGQMTVLESNQNMPDGTCCHCGTSSLPFFACFAGLNPVQTIAQTLRTGSIVVVQDADLEYGPREIPDLIGPIKEGAADVCLGSRFLVRRAGRVLYFRHFLANKLLTFFNNFCTDLNLTDVETGYKAARLRSPRI